MGRTAAASTCEHTVQDALFQANLYFSSTPLPWFFPCAAPPLWRKKVPADLRMQVE